MRPEGPPEEPSFGVGRYCVVQHQASDLDPQPRIQPVEPRRNRPLLHRHRQHDHAGELGRNDVRRLVHQADLQARHRHGPAVMVLGDIGLGLGERDRLDRVP